MLQWINDLLDQEFPTREMSLLSPGLRRTLRQLLQDCESLYASAARRCLQNCPDSVPGEPRKFRELMQDLHRGVLIKTAHRDRSCRSQVDAGGTRSCGHRHAACVGCAGYE